MCKSRVCCCLVLGLLGGLAGCGKETTAVTGKVLLGNQPLTTGTVIFHPDASKGNTSKHEPRAQIDKQGNYRLTTAGKEGAPRGWYKVSVTALKDPDKANPYAEPHWLIDRKYGDAEKAGLPIEVVEKPQPGAYDLTLKP